MKKIWVLSMCVALGLVVAGCLPASPTQAPNPTPISESDLRLTAAVLSQQTLQAIPTNTLLPSKTPVIVTPSSTPIQPTPTETENPVWLTLTATLNAGTAAVNEATQTAMGIAGTLPSVGTSTPTTNPLTVTGTPHPLFYGTLPPNLPYGTIQLFNKSHVDVYISLRCVTKDGYVTILEYPVKRIVNTSAPAGNYTYVAWVGGRQFDGSFSLANDGFATVTFFKDKVNIKTK